MSDFRIVQNKRDAYNQINKILNSLEPGDGIPLKAIKKQIMINNGISGQFVIEYVKDLIDDDFYIELDTLYRKEAPKVAVKQSISDIEAEAEATFKAMGLK